MFVSTWIQSGDVRHTVISTVKVQNLRRYHFTSTRMAKLEGWQYQMLGKMCHYLNLHLLILTVKNGTISLENTVIVLKRNVYTSALWLSNSSWKVAPWAFSLLISEALPATVQRLFQEYITGKDFLMPPFMDFIFALQTITEEQYWQSIWEYCSTEQVN